MLGHNKDGDSSPYNKPSFLGNKSIQSNQTAYDANWAANPSFGHFPQPSAPHTPSAGQHGHLDGYNTLDHGSFPYTDPSTFTRIPSSAPPTEGFLDARVLDDLEHVSSINRNSAYNTSTPYSSTQPAPLFDQGQQYQFGFQLPLANSPRTSNLHHMSSNPASPKESSWLHSLRSQPFVGPQPSEHLLSSIVPPSMRKRLHDNSTSSIADSSDSSLRSANQRPPLNESIRSKRRKSVSSQRSTAWATESTEYHRSKVGLVDNQPESWPVKTAKLSEKQERFIRNWFEDFAEGNTRSCVPFEEINALATLVKAPSQSVWDHVNESYIGPDAARLECSLQSSRTTPLGSTCENAHSGYSVVEANKHLPSATLTLVEKYVRASQRRRAQKDGRRRVNEGPFRCIFGCGYRTKRAYDWRRHEETHEPQELWLCHFCCQSAESTPFLVNRRDKFLKHAKLIHKDRDAEEVLDMSKVNFRAKFDPQCPFCPEVSDTWDDRCKHVLAHFEDEIHRKSLRLTSHAEAEAHLSLLSDKEGGDHLDDSTSAGSSESADDGMYIFQQEPNTSIPTGRTDGGSGDIES